LLERREDLEGNTERKQRSKSRKYIVPSVMCVKTGRTELVLQELGFQDILLNKSPNPSALGSGKTCDVHTPSHEMTAGLVAWCEGMYHLY